jgi:hypothetical protein
MSKYVVPIFPARALDKYVCHGLVKEDGLVAAVGRMSQTIGPIRISHTIRILELTYGHQPQLLFDFRHCPQFEMVQHAFIRLSSLKD